MSTTISYYVKFWHGLHCIVVTMCCSVDYNMEWHLLRSRMYCGFVSFGGSEYAGRTVYFWQSSILGWSGMCWWRGICGRSSVRGSPLSLVPHSHSYHLSPLRPFPSPLSLTSWSSLPALLFHHTPRVHPADMCVHALSIRSMYEMDTISLQNIMLIWSTT